MPEPFRAGFCADVFPCRYPVSDFPKPAVPNLHVLPDGLPIAAAGVRDFSLLFKGNDEAIQDNHAANGYLGVLQPLARLVFQDMANRCAEALGPCPDDTACRAGCTAAGAACVAGCSSYGEYCSPACDALANACNALCEAEEESLFCFTVSDQPLFE